MSVIKFGAWQDLSGNEVANSTEPIGDVGLVLIKSQTVGSGVSSVTLSDSFSADFDVYKITYVGIDHTGDAGLKLTLGSSSSGYYGALLYNRYDGTSGSLLVSNGSYAWVGVTGDTNDTQGSIEVHNPYATNRTNISGVGFGYSSAFQFGSLHAPATSHTGFTLAPNSGTISGGTIRVYGYRN
jgi:hypothetical protein